MTEKHVFHGAQNVAITGGTFNAAEAINYYTSASKRTISDAAIPVKPNSSIRFTGRTDVLAKLSQEAIRLMPKFLPLTKIKYMMEVLMKGIVNLKRPEEKTLVISLWAGCLFLVSDYLIKKGIVRVKYQGDMNRNKCDQAVRVFMSKDKARVTLPMSLKCGAVGLNLTRANNIISLDLGWSRAIQDQAFDRVHHLGQTRPVELQRLVIPDTVEDRLLNIQERNQCLADGSLGEGTGKKISNRAFIPLSLL